MEFHGVVGEVWLVGRARHDDEDVELLSRYARHGERVAERFLAHVCRRRDFFSLGFGGDSAAAIEIERPEEPALGDASSRTELLWRPSRDGARYLLVGHDVRRDVSASAHDTKGLLGSHPDVLIHASGELQVGGQRAAAESRRFVVAGSCGIGRVVCRSVQTVRVCQPASTCCGAQILRT